MKITIIGTGYVGLVTGACLAEIGNDVLCLDVDARKIAVLQRRRRSRSTSRAWRRSSRATSPPAACASPPTSPRPSRTARCSSSPSARRRTRTARADLQYVLAAARNIGRHMTDYKVVVDKSTVPVGTADRVRRRDRGGAGRARRDDPVRGRLQPRVPEGRRGGRGLHAARPHRDRRRRPRARSRAAARRCTRRSTATTSASW